MAVIKDHSKASPRSVIVRPMQKACKVGAWWTSNGELGVPKLGRCKRKSPLPTNCAPDIEGTWRRLTLDNHNGWAET